MRNLFCILIGLGAITFSQASYKWTQVAAGNTTRAIVDIAPTPGGFVAVGYETILQGSQDNWKHPASPLTNANYLGVAFQGDTGIAVAEGGAVISSVDGGVHWQAFPLNAQQCTFQSVEASPSNGFWIAASRGRLLHISKDLATVTTDTLDTTLTFQRMVATNVGLWALASNGVRYVHSTMGTWVKSGNVFGANPGDSLFLDVAEYLPSGYWVAASKTTCVGIAGCQTLKSVVRYSSLGEIWTDTLILTGSAARSKRILDISGSGDSLVVVVSGQIGGAVSDSANMLEIRKNFPLAPFQNLGFGPLRSVAFNGAETVLGGEVGLLLSNAVPPPPTALRPRQVIRPSISMGRFVDLLGRER